jgi:hypothetical protein
MRVSECALGNSRRGILLLRSPCAHSKPQFISVMWPRPPGTRWGRRGDRGRALGGDLRAAPILHYPRCHSHNILDHLSGRPQLMRGFAVALSVRTVRENWLKLINCEVTRGHPATSDGEFSNSIEMPSFEEELVRQVGGTGSCPLWAF